MDILDKIARQSLETIKSGYYEVNIEAEGKKPSLKGSLNEREFSLIGELKFASPSLGKFREIKDYELIVKTMEKYCTGISVLTEPKSFFGSLEIFSRVREIVDLPLLMKDFVISEDQIKASERIGADAVLLIFSLAKRGYFELDEMIEFSHEKGIEVVLEVHSREELEKAIDTEADIIGVNNRDLRTMETNTYNTFEILKDFHSKKPILSESGFRRRKDVLKVRKLVDGILVGTALMTSDDLEGKLRELSLCG
ncbi:MAG: indole-3-glycerol-phosphate synthase [Candidatus Methanofastidiosia archaeon]